MNNDLIEWLFKNTLIGNTMYSRYCLESVIKAHQMQSAIFITAHKYAVRNDIDDPLTEIYSSLCSRADCGSCSLCRTNHIICEIIDDDNIEKSTKETALLLLLFSFGFINSGIDLD